jgi:acyl-coenzyme A synthetase/AMP-(fatty) acid ligase
MQTVFLRFTEQVKSNPARKALVVDENEYSYQELYDVVEQLCSNLTLMGFRGNDHVAVLLPNSAEFIIILLAASALGLVIIPNNLSIPADKLAVMFEQCRIKHKIVWHGIVSDVKPCIDVFEEKLNSNDTSLWISVGGDKEGCVSFNSLLKNTDATFKYPQVEPDAPFVITMTSGSTSEPKPIVLSQKTKLERANAAQALYEVTNRDVILAATPLYHSLAERLAIVALTLGSTLILMNGFSCKKWLQQIEKYKVSFTISVSSQLKQVVLMMEKYGYRVDSLRCLVSSSELLDSKSKSAAIKLLNCDFHECYGTSEVSIVSSLNAQKERNKTGSVGKAAPGVEIQILDDSGGIAGRGEVGEIICSTSLGFNEYFRQGSQTTAAYWNDFFRTGDIGKLDSDGYLYFLGRKKDIIITGGVNVYPKDIEKVLSTHPDVEDVAVVAFPHEQLGECVAAAIVCRGEKKINRRELQKLTAVGLADYQQPLKYFFVDYLSTNGMGKIVKRNVIRQISKIEENKLSRNRQIERMSE